MTNTSPRLRMTALTGCTSLLVLAASTLFAGCSTGVSTSTATDESVAQTRDALLTIPTPDPSVNIQFGTSVAADSQTLIIGDNQAKALATDGQLHNKGQVHVYTRNGGIESWQPLQILKPFGPVTGEVHFGQRLALHGNLLVVSADRDALDCGTYPCANTDDDQQQGSFYVFTRTGPGQPFTQVGTKYTEPSPVRENRFGLFVATNGKFIAAAAGVLDGGNGFDVRIFTIQANGSVVYSYSVDPTLKPLGMAMTESGILVAVPGTGPGVVAYQLQATQAVPLANTSTLGTGYLDVVANGNSIALLDATSGGRVVTAPLTSAGVGAVTTIGPALGLVNARSLNLVENQRVLVGDQDPARARLAKYELGNGAWTNTGFIYPPLVTRLTQTGFAAVLASTSEFVVAGQVGQVLVSSLETGARLEGATFEKQRILPRDACGTSCGGQSFLSAEFGRETAISGDVAAAVQVELAGVRDPSVHIYTRQAGVWSHTGQFSFPGKNVRDVAVDSGRVYVGVGTPGPSVPGSFIDGSVLVYERDANQVWHNVATLVASDSTSFSATFVGDSIAASGNVVAIGSYGFVYLFLRDAGGAWSQLQKLPVTPFTSPQGIAHSVALSDTYLVVGVRRDSSAVADQGSVFVYRRSDWTLDQKFGPQSSFNGGMEYGYSVAIDGTTILIGAPDGGEFNGGFVEVRDRTGTGATPWQFTTTLGIVIVGFDYRVGTAVSLAGNQALLGAVGDPLTGGQGGAAYLIPRVNGTWDETKAHTLLSSDFGPSGGSSFGWGVQLSGTSAIVGAPLALGIDGGGAAYLFDGLVDADGDGLLAADDCNDSDGVALSCVLGAANLSFEPPPQPAWTADAGSFTFSTTHTDGTTSLKLGTGAAKLTGPLFSTTILREVGSALAFDVQRATGGSNAVTLFYSVPALNVVQSVIGTIDLSAVPTGTWKTVSLPIPAALRNVLLGQSTNVRFHLQFNVSAPNLLIDHLRFTGTFSPRSAPPPAGAVTATLTTNSSSSSNYCVALKLGNSGTSPTTTWSVVLNMQGTTITNSWNAAFSGTTGTVTINNNQAFNASIPAGATAFDPSVGFCANRPAGSPTAIATVVSASGQ